MSFKLNTKSEYLFIIGFITIYISIFQGLGETQPIILLTIGFLVIALKIKRLVFSEHKTLEKKIIYLSLIFFIYFSFLFLNVFLGYGDNLSMLKYLVVTFIFFAVLSFNPLTEDNRKLYAIFFGLTVLITVLYKYNFFYFSVFYDYFLNLFIPRALESNFISNRGVTILAPEQSYMAMLVISLYLVFETKFLHYKNGHHQYNLITMCLYVLLIMIGSLIGLLFILIHVAQLMLSRLNLRTNVLIIIILVVFLIYLSSSLANTRFFQFFQLFFDFVKSPESFLEILLIDPSASVRIILGVSSIINGFENLILMEPGYQKNNWYLAFDGALSQIVTNNPVLSSQYYDRLSTEPQTLFYALWSDLGAISFLFFVILIWTIFPKKVKFNKNSIALYFFLFIVVFYQGGLTAPYLALLLMLWFRRSNVF